MFPAWKTVESPYHWSGMVCISRNRVPFVGPVPGHPGMFAGLTYHGNGVAMGGYSGRLLADLVQGRETAATYPMLMRHPPKRFPLGRFRRALMPPVYGLMGLRDL
jgi:glycine/D-amino acid oxidase-like deaminating enzyme